MSRTTLYYWYHNNMYGMYFNISGPLLSTNTWFRVCSLTNPTVKFALKNTRAYTLHPCSLIDTSINSNTHECNGCAKIPSAGHKVCVKTTGKFSCRHFPQRSYSYAYQLFLDRAKKSAVRYHIQCAWYSFWLMYWLINRKLRWLDSGKYQLFLFLDIH